MNDIKLRFSFSVQPAYIRFQYLYTFISITDKKFSLIHLDGVNYEKNKNFFVHASHFLNKS